MISTTTDLRKQLRQASREETEAQKPYTEVRRKKQLGKEQDWELPILAKTGAHSGADS